MELRPPIVVSVRHWYEEWMQYARCSWIEPDAWFPEVGGNARFAKNICQRQCPVRDRCLDYAMNYELGATNTQRSGIYGGLSPAERKKYEPEWLANRGAA